MIHAATADHLDVVGHFEFPHHSPPHHDWLHCGARFDRRAFESLWSDVVDFLVAPAA